MVQIKKLLPPAVRICGVVYPVDEVLDLRDDAQEYYGRVVHTHPRIEVEDDMALEVKVQALLHEMFHGLFHLTGHSGFEKEEAIVQVLGCQLPQLLRDNPEIVRLIMGDDTRVVFRHSVTVSPAAKERLKAGMGLSEDDFVSAAKEELESLSDDDYRHLVFGEFVKGEHVVSKYSSPTITTIRFCASCGKEIRDSEGLPHHAHEGLRFCDEVCFKNYQR